MLKSHFDKVAGLQTVNFIKRLQLTCFTVKFTGFLGTTILKNISERLFLNDSMYMT